MEPIALSKELVAASSRPMVLSILAGGESYGYEILQRVALLSRGRVQWSDGMLYPVLRRLEKEGLIAGEWRTMESGRRRRYYRLSEKGRRQLSADRESWLVVHRALSETWG
jgi:DNA-binding PadR family transcriptional regulator